MNHVRARFLFLSVVLCAFAGLTGLAQDFQRSFNLGAGGSVNVRNVSGDVIVSGYEGNAVVVTAVKEGRDRDRVSIEDQSSGGAVDVRVRYPEQCNCDASVRFEVKVPRSVAYRFDAFSSVSGDVEVKGVTGDLRAKSVSGNVTVNGVSGAVNANSVSGTVHVGEINGTVNAKSTSGNVEVEIRQLYGEGNLEFSSVSGDVRVKLPGNLAADVKLSTLSGDLRTDFPLTIEEAKFGPGRRANGMVGGGGRALKLSSTSGSVSLIRM